MQGKRALKRAIRGSKKKHPQELVAVLAVMVKGRRYPLAMLFEMKSIRWT